MSSPAGILEGGVRSLSNAEVLIVSVFFVGDFGSGFSLVDVIQLKRAI